MCVTVAENADSVQEFGRFDCNGKAVTAPCDQSNQLTLTIPKSVILWNAPSPLSPALLQKVSVAPDCIVNLYYVKRTLLAQISGDSDVENNKNYWP